MGSTFERKVGRHLRVVLLLKQRVRYPTAEVSYAYMPDSDVIARRWGMDVAIGVTSDITYLESYGIVKVLVEEDWLIHRRAYLRIRIRVANQEKQYTSNTNPHPFHPTHAVGILYCFIW